MGIVEVERKKYSKIWGEVPAYRDFSPGEQLAGIFIFLVKPKVGATIGDFGCGPGRASATFAEAGYSPILVDIASNCLDHEVSQLLGSVLYIGCLWDIQLPKKVDYGYCVDVMEHIVPEYVDDTIHNIMSNVVPGGKVFFHICLHEDHFGQAIDEQLHLTVKPFPWWRDKFTELGYEVLDARDLQFNGLYIVTHGGPTDAAA